MKRVIRLLGSLTIAVPLLITIATVLAWGTMYEARFGTAAVQRFVYRAWWFQALLGFLAINLAIAALGRSPWQRRHIPFVLAHIGIILILIGGILGSRFGIEGQMIIPEGQAEHTLELPGNVLVVHLPNPGRQEVIPTQFETQAWMHDPRVTLPLTLDGRRIQLSVDRYYPDAVFEEEITNDGPEENPAVRVVLEHNEQQDAMWFFSRDPERFGVRWGDAHVLFLEPKTSSQFDQLIGRSRIDVYPRGVISLKLSGLKQPRDIPVPLELNQTVPITGTPYRITFKDYFPDFAMTEQGLGSRSAQPNNPALSFLLTGPEGTDAYLLFALHPDFQAIHGVQHTIPAQVSYVHAASNSLPPHAIGILLAPSGLPAPASGRQAGTLAAVLTGSGIEHQVINPVEMNTSYAHPSLGYQWSVSAYYPRALIRPRVTNRGDEVHTEAIHLIGREADQTAQTWVSVRGTAQLDLGKEPLTVEYQPARRDLSVSIKLLAFRKIDYPGTQMASAFESDVELTDAQRGVILMRKISMNNPLRYRGFSFYQSSYIDGPTKTTVLSVRHDPGTPFVYAGFLIVILGVVSMFVLGDPTANAVNMPQPKHTSTTRKRKRSRAS